MITVKRKVAKVSLPDRTTNDILSVFCIHPRLACFATLEKIKRYRIIDSESKLADLRNKMRGLEEFAFDTETNTLRVYGPNKDFKLVGISISWGEYNNYYIPVGHVREEDYGRNIDPETIRFYLKDIFEKTNVRIIGWNLKYDMHVMSRIGIYIHTHDLFDGMIASWLCNENTPNGLKENTTYNLGVDQTHFAEVTNNVPAEVKKEFGLKASSKATFDMVLIDEGAPYALCDSFFTYANYLGLMELLEEEKMDKVYWKVYTKFIRTLYNMEESGTTVAVEKLDGMSIEIAKDMEKLVYEMYELSGVEFSPTSNAQLVELLFGYCPSEKTVDISKQPKIVQRMVAEEDTVALESRGLRLEFDTMHSGRVPVLYKITGTPALQDKSFKFHILSTTSGGAPQVNADVLWKLSHMEFKAKRKQEGVKLCEKLLEYKKLDKLRGAFIEGLKEQLYDDGKVHPSFNIIGTDSGRISCSSPNLQQLPKAGEDDKYQIRSLFIGSEYIASIDTEGKPHYVGEYAPDTELGKHQEVRRKMIMAADFANLEMRVLAHFSRDENLLKMFESGADTHGFTAVTMFGLDCDASEVKKKYPHLRQAAKVLNFLLMYGGGAFRLYNSLKENHESPIDLGSKEYTDLYHAKTGEDVAQIYIDKYFSTFSGVAKFIKDQKRYAHKHGYVYTLLKRKRRLPNINSNDFKLVSYDERLSVNACVQGSAADMTMSAQNRCDADPWFKEHGCKMLIQVHDELVWECPEEWVDECTERVQKYMAHPFGDGVELNLPFRADADKGWNYSEAK